MGHGKTNVKAIPGKEGRKQRVVENISIHGNHIPEKDFEKSKDSVLYPAKTISKFCKIICFSL